LMKVMPVKRWYYSWIF